MERDTRHIARGVSPYVRCRTEIGSSADYSFSSGAGAVVPMAHPALPRSALDPMTVLRHLRKRWSVAANGRMT